MDNIRWHYEPFEFDGKGDEGGYYNLYLNDQDTGVHVQDNRVISGMEVGGTDRYAVQSMHGSGKNLSMRHYGDFATFDEAKAVALSVMKSKEHGLLRTVAALGELTEGEK